MSGGLVVRVDAGPSIGLGHLQRALALAAAFTEAGRRVCFVVNREFAAAERVAAAGWGTTLVPAPSWTDDDADAVISVAQQESADIVVVDSDLAPASYGRRLRAAGLFVCAVDDSGNGEVEADVGLNGDAHAGLGQDRTGRETRLVLGPTFAPLLPEYWCAGVPAADVPAAVVLVTVGGADAHGLLPVLLCEAQRLPAALRLEVVVGPFCEYAEQIERTVSLFAGRARLHRAPAGMFGLIANCDMAITAAGQTMYELAALGRPAVAFQVADNQAPQLAEFVRHGVVISAGTVADPAVATRAVTLASALAVDGPRLERMAAAGRRFIDGRGALRAAAAVLSVAAQSAPISNV